MWVEVGADGLPALASQGPAVVFFHATDCRVCRGAAPALERLGPQLVSAGVHLFRVRADADFSLAREWQVLATPTFILVDAGGRRRRLEGFPGSDAFLAVLRQALLLPVELRAFDQVPQKVR